MNEDPERIFGLRKDGLRTATFQAGVFITVVCTTVILFELITALYRSPDVLREIYGYVSGILVIIPVPVTIFTITGNALQLFYIMILITVTVAVGYLLWKSVPAMIRFTKDKEPDTIKKSMMFEFGTLFAAMYLVQTAFILLLVLAGVDVAGTVPFDDKTKLEMMYLTIEASVWEELVSRVLLIGVPMLVLAFIASDRKKWWKWLSGGFGMSRNAALLILFSALFFGIAHVPGWDLWKFLPAFITGLGLGYLFVRYGLYAAIAMHFMFNYLSSSDWLLNDGGVLLSLVAILIALFGIPYAWLYTKRGLDYLKVEFRRA